MIPVVGMIDTRPNDCPPAPSSTVARRRWVLLGNLDLERDRDQPSVLHCFTIIDPTLWGKSHHWLNRIRASAQRVIVVKTGTDYQSHGDGSWICGG